MRDKQTYPDQLCISTILLKENEPNQLVNIMKELNGNIKIHGDGMIEIDGIVATEHKIFLNVKSESLRRLCSHLLTRLHRRGIDCVNPNTETFNIVLFKRDWVPNDNFEGKSRPFFKLAKTYESN